MRDGQTDTDSRRYWSHEERQTFRKTEIDRDRQTEETDRETETETQTGVRERQTDRPADRLVT